MSRYPAVLEYFGINSRGFRAVYLRLRDIFRRCISYGRLDRGNGSVVRISEKIEVVGGGFRWLSFCVSAHEFPAFFYGWEVWNANSRMKIVKQIYGPNSLWCLGGVFDLFGNLGGVRMSSVN